MHFADDLNLRSSLCFEMKHKQCMSISTKISRLNSELESISLWLRCNKLKLNYDKTTSMLFHHRQKSLDVEALPPLFIDGFQIKIENSFNFLGIYFDKHMTWTDHIWHITKNIRNTCGILNVLKQWYQSIY